MRRDVSGGGRRGARRFKMSCSSAMDRGIEKRYVVETLLATSPLTRSKNAHAASNPMVEAYRRPQRFKALYAGDVASNVSTDGVCLGPVYWIVANVFAHGGDPGISAEDVIMESRLPDDLVVPKPAALQC